MNPDQTEAAQFAHTDTLAALNRGIPLERKLRTIHESIAQQFPFVERISVAAYDEATDLLKTFLASSPGSNQLVRYQARLSDTPSLAATLKAGRPRVVNDMRVFGGNRQLHTKVISSEGYEASYTIPMCFEGTFWGFIFFNSRTPGVFTDAVLPVLDVYAHLISAIVTAELMAVRMLAAAVKTAHDMVHYRDPETGGHIDRMSRYSRLIAQYLSATGAATLDDATIERIFEFAPLHDIGKIATPDRILLKAGPLSAPEKSEMEQHTVRGRQMIEAIAHNFGLDRLDGLDLLRHIAEFHHEKMDGSGYPQHLQGKEIPIEARIVAVADVFDALTSARPYKPSWSNEQAFEWLRSMARTQFDEDCVNALIYNTARVREIQEQFRDEPPAADVENLR